jgi:hypothetical protein
MAGDDKAFLKVLERYGSPADVAKAHREIVGKMSAGELKAPAKPLPANATDEQKAAWRAENGLPANADGYVAALKLPEGLVAGDADKPMLADFAKAAADAGLDQKSYDAACSFYFANQDRLTRERDTADGTFKNSGLVELGQEWGKDFQGNINAVGSVVALLPESIRDDLLTARLPNGRIVGDDPNFNRAMLLLAKQINPAATLLPNVGAGGLSGVESQIAAHEANMNSPQGSDKWRAYWKSEKAQSEYRELLGARETMRSRANAA